MKRTIHVAAVALTLAGLGIAAKRPMTTDTQFDLRTVGDPQIKKDGSSVVYVLGWADKMNDAFHSNLWIASADGKDQRPITQGSYRDSSPRWEYATPSCPREFSSPTA